MPTKFDIIVFGIVIVQRDHPDVARRQPLAQLVVVLSLESLVANVNAGVGCEREVVVTQSVDNGAKRCPRTQPRFRGVGQRQERRGGTRSEHGPIVFDQRHGHAERRRGPRGQGPFHGIAVDVDDARKGQQSSTIDAWHSGRHRNLTDVFDVPVVDQDRYLIDQRIADEGSDIGDGTAHGANVPGRIERGLNGGWTNGSRTQATRPIGGSCDSADPKPP